MLVVVDTNVPVVANGKSTQASPNCVKECLHRIGRIIQGQDRLVLDNHWRILREYQSNLSPSGQPGIGDAFLKWVLTNQANRKKCECIHITNIDSGEDDFVEFPIDPDLKNFDRSDRKFVAVALAHKRHPVILQAVDTDWWVARQALQRNGVRVKFLCPEDIS